MIRGYDISLSIANLLLDASVGEEKRSMVGKGGGGLFNKMAALTWATKERSRERHTHTRTL